VPIDPFQEKSNDVVPILIFLFCSARLFGNILLHPVKVLFRDFPPGVALLQNLQGCLCRSFVSFQRPYATRQDDEVGFRPHRFLYKGDPDLVVPRKAPDGLIPIQVFLNSTGLTLS
jgi:hypothetical protein